jgi:hypothetical protein
MHTPLFRDTLYIENCFQNVARKRFKSTSLGVFPKLIHFPDISIIPEFMLATHHPFVINFALLTQVNKSNELKR